MSRKSWNENVGKKNAELLCFTKRSELVHLMQETSYFDVKPKNVKKLF